MLSARPTPYLTLGVLTATVAAIAIHQPALACTNADIAATIDATGAELRRLNASHHPSLQAKIRRLGELRKWPDSELNERSAEVLEDDETRALDEQVAQLLNEVDTLGDETSGDKIPCEARLEKLKTVSAQLIEVTTAKAVHVTARLDTAIAAEGGTKTAVRPDPRGGADSRSPGRPAAAPETKGPSPRPVPAEKPAAKQVPAPGWETDTVRRTKPDDLAAVDQSQQPFVAAPDPQAADAEFSMDDIRAAGRGFFGSISANLASVIEYTFRQYGRPTGYILGTEGGGALLAGLRYGEGRLVTKFGGEQKVYWQGPSVGYDFGLAGSRVMFLVYSIRDHQELFARFAGVDGSAYLVGGVGVTFLKKGRVILAPIRTGLGLRVGANVGYLKFTPKPSYNPF